MSGESTMTPEPSPFTTAQQRAMPVTRLLDCGMDYADATALHARTLAEEHWDVVAEALADAQFARVALAASAGHLKTAADAQSMVALSFRLAVRSSLI